jgi:hypothetical protein
MAGMLDSSHGQQSHAPAAMAVEEGTISCLLTLLQLARLMAQRLLPHK